MKRFIKLSFLAGLIIGILYLTSYSQDANVSVALSSETVQTIQAPKKSSAEIKKEKAKAEAAAKAQKKAIAADLKTIKDYESDKEYFRAADGLLALMIKYPGDKSIMDNYNRISSKMKKMAAKGKDPMDFGKRNYAIAFGAYLEGDMNTASMELEKVVYFSGNTSEVEQYIKYLQYEVKASKILDEGIKQFGAKKYYDTVAQMDKLLTFINDNYFPQYIIYTNAAKEYIEKSIQVLSKTQPKKTNTVSVNISSSDANNTPSENNNIVLSNEKYSEGFAMYSQGKYTEAENLWQYALRLNPQNRKAQVALLDLQIELKNNDFVLKEFNMTGTQK